MSVVSLVSEVSLVSVVSLVFVVSLVSEVSLVSVVSLGVSDVCGVLGVCAVSKVSLVSLVFPAHPGVCCACDIMSLVTFMTLSLTMKIDSILLHLKIDSILLHKPAAHKDISMVNSLGPRLIIIYAYALPELITPLACVQLTFGCEMLAGVYRAFRLLLCSSWTQAPSIRRRRTY